MSLLAPSGSAAGSSSPLVPRSPSGSSGDEAEAQQPPSQFFRSLKLGKGKSQTWSPEDPPRQRHHSPAGGGFPSTSSSSSGEVKTSSPSRARRASKMFRKLGGSRIVAPSNHHHQHEVASASPSAVTPPLWLPLVDFLCRAVEQHGVDKMGIFRLSANARTVRELLQACVGLYEKRAGEEAMARLFAPYEGEVDVAASVLKAYLREQTQPLIPTTHHDRFVSVLAQHAYELPDELKSILERLTRSLHMIQANQEVNRMDASNLAIVFAPSLLRAETEGLDIVKIRSQCQVIETFIFHHNRIFTPEREEKARELRLKDVVAAIHEVHTNDEWREECDERAEEAAFARVVSKLTQEAADEEHEAMKEHRWKKEHLGPFSSLSCQFCHKAIFGIRHKAKCRRRAGNTCSGALGVERPSGTSQPAVVIVEGSWSRPVGK
ncbi:RhoGAP domain containing protein [Acanthamoeba castellanii str. Neff]|uniref:RhoGAP domain containing protein n=1 Tax=Acanthamoeba castellanii (strain ATCC 30010 / Neff) TaxID=1257118 RepID=L8H6S7_ACACF|nr:RhoGAP domain containing protein [Acanthamoeba castellanii str. Neff]ELR21214.1 RhoGAP domain containing protein [Acanthamoeba castellanii str. Neff]